MKQTAKNPARPESPWPGGVRPSEWAWRIATARTREERARIIAQVPNELGPLVRSFLDVWAMKERVRKRLEREPPF